MKITIVHSDVKIEYEDDRSSANIMGSYNSNELPVVEIINSLGQLVKIIKDEQAKEDRGA